ncbi:unnamed protein product [Effrenium voratum]|nr:unnamed protein product [Effrenium voratum]
MGCKRAVVLRLLALSHVCFALLLLAILLFRLWEGDVLVQCGHNGPYIGGKCVCGGTLPYICWISDSFNGLWGEEPGMDQRVVWQSRCWLVLALFPGFLGLLLISSRSHARRRTDVLVGLMSWTYALLVVFPDTLPSEWLWLHFGTAMLAMASAAIFQLVLPWRCLVCTSLSYVLYYFALSEFCVFCGAARHWVYDWSFTPGVLQAPGSLVMVILEWTLSLAGITVVATYCVSESFDCWDQKPLNSVHFDQP